jgi:hypothetical protein
LANIDWIEFGKSRANLCTAGKIINKETRRGLKYHRKIPT